MNNNSDKYLRLLIGFGIYQLSLHIIYLFSSKDPRVLLPHGIAFLHDLLSLSIFYFTVITAERLLPAALGYIGEKIFVAGFLTAGFLLSLYPRFLREYLIFPVNIFDSELSTSKSLILEYLGLFALMPSAVAIIWGVILILTKTDFQISGRLKIILFSIIVIASFLSFRNPSPQPLIYSLQSEAESIIKHEKRVVSSLKINSKEGNGKIDMLHYPGQRLQTYDHILFIVLEGVTAENFESEFLVLTDGFFQSNKGHSAYYKNYYATNLDSYTSLIAMMTGILVPYRSYADDKYYNKVNRELNLVDYFNKNQFRSSFVSTFENHPYVPSRDFWNNIYIRKDFKNIDRYRSIGSGRMETATEDKLALDKIINEIKNNDKTFILHELAYGHSPEWRATIGKTQLRYYDEYLAELSEKIKEENLYDKTLFAIVSDHGDRANPGLMENYRVPLLFVGEKIGATENYQFFSHLDLPELAWYHLGLESHPSDSKEIYTVGSSDKWVYGKITSDKKHIYIDNAKGTVISKSGGIDPPQVNSEFQNYLNVFNKKYGR